MRRVPLLVALALLLAPSRVEAQFPPDSLVNTHVIDHATPVTRVIGMMRNFTGDLGVRCHFCHLGEEGQPLGRYDFASDEKRPKLVAREMMRMVAEINRRLDSLPGRDAQGLRVTCRTCHRGVSRPVPLSTVIADAAVTSGADSAVVTYRGLRERYYGRDAYDFGESSLNIAAFRLARESRFAEALVLLDLNERDYPASSALAVFRGNILVLRGDTTAAVAAFREAVRRDSTNAEARGRLRELTGSR